MEEAENKREITIKKDWKPILLYIFIEFFLSIVATIICTFIMKVKGIVIEFTDFAYIMTIAVCILNFVVCAILYHKRFINDLKKIKKSTLIKILIATAIAVTLNEIICILFEHFNVKMDNQNIVSDMFFKFPILSTIMIVTASFTEELIFRYSFRTIIKNKIAFVIVSSLFFGLMHGIGIVSILYVSVGAFLSIMYLKTDDNIASVTIAHTINNIVGIIEMILL